MPATELLRIRALIEDVLTPIAFQGVTGFICGFVAGYALKKIAKIVAVILGVFILALMYLSHVGIVSVNYDKLFNLISSYLEHVHVPSAFTATLISYLPVVGTFTIGFAVGFKKG